MKKYLYIILCICLLEIGCISQERFWEQQSRNTTYTTSDQTLNKLEPYIHETLLSNAVSSKADKTLYGFSAGAIYPQFWVRDSSSLLQATRYYLNESFISSWIEGHLEVQKDNGEVYDFIGVNGSVDKNNVLSDQESLLVHSAYQYYKITENKNWLQKAISGRSVISRLNDSLNFLLSNRFDVNHGLITGAHTADFGDVQFEDGSTKITNETHWISGIANNANFYMAANELSEMYNDLGDKESAILWKNKANEIRNSVNRYLWQEDKGFYKIHVHVTPLSHPFDEDKMFPFAGNVLAVYSGIANESQAERIFNVVKEVQINSNSSTIAPGIFPPYPDGFFKNPILDERYEYQNGGVWDWFGGRLITMEFKHGFVDIARTQLKEIALRVSKSNGLYEWNALNGSGFGSSKFAGSAGALGEAMFRGYFGVELSSSHLSVSPNLGTDNGSVYLYEPTTHYYVTYNYTFSSNTSLFDYETNFPKEAEFKLLTPCNAPTVYGLIDFNISDVNGETYLISSIGRRASILIVCAGQGTI